MSRLKEVFGKGKAFVAFLTAGDPTAECTVNYILKMEKAGADLIEIGIPFSDPTAEGAAVQEASLRALKGGMTTEGVFHIVEEVRKKSQVPLALTTYLNPVFHYGYDAFFARCRSLGVDGIIVSDLPFEEKKEAEEVAGRFGIDVISLVAPTSMERIRLIASEAKGFIYVEPSMAATGVHSRITTDIAGMVKEIRAVTDTPCVIGFGINTPEQAGEMARYADGVIVGSAIAGLIGQYGEAAGEEIYRYVRGMKAAIA